jgi:Leucine-rich repeat (LRR) protein
MDINPYIYIDSSGKKTLNFYDLDLTELPENLPDDTETLNCVGNSLTQLPKLPEGLNKLLCSNNKLTTLPELPPNLKKLSCPVNQLTSLPELNEGLSSIECTFNKLTQLPKLPNTLTHLFCSNNQLTNLPELPNSLTHLVCKDNQLTIIPELPNSLLNFISWRNPFIAPFDTFIDEYNMSDDIDKLKEDVNGYYAEKRAKGRNLGGLMATLGRSEVQGRLGLGNNNTPRNVNPNGTRKTVNRLPMNALALTGSFLTGHPGSVNQQRNTLRNTRRNRKTRKQKGAGGFLSTPEQRENIELDYSNRGLTTENLGELLTEYTPRERDSISNLIVSGNNLNELPAVPLQNLISLECDNNQLTLLYTSHYPDFLRSLSDLYPHLQRLYCSRNQLTSLPRLSPNIVIIECDNNQLTALPKLPESLNFLICNNNQLRVLPELPENLQEIDCDANPFISPFDNFVEEYNNTHDITVLINKVNNYYSQQRSMGRNLMAMKATLGRREYQENMGLGNANTPRNVNNVQMRNIGNNGKVRKVMVGNEKIFNKVPKGPQALVASFLTGQRGSVNQQESAIKNILRRSRKNRKTRKH